jgi:MFS family permease
MGSEPISTGNDTLPSALPPLAALRYRDFALYASARFCATLAWQMLAVAVGWQVWQLTRDPLDLAFVGLAQFLPFLILVLPAGQVADRADRRLVLVGAYTAEAVCAALLFVFSAVGLTTAWPILAALIFFGAGRAFWMPAAQAMTVNLVPAAAFPSAVAINSTLFQCAVVAGPAVGGLLLIAGPKVVYGTVLGLLVTVVILVVAIRPVRSAASARPFRLRDVLEGLRFVIRRRTVFGAISLDLFAVLFGGATALLPIYASDVLRVGPDGYGVLRTAPAIGAAITAGVLALVPMQRHVGRWMFGGVALFGGATIVFGLSTVFWVSLVALFLLGVGDMVSVFIRHLLVQLETPDAIRGRVSAVNSMFIGASNELGEFESGVLARFVGAVPAVVIGGIATLGIVGLYLRLFPELRVMDRFPPAHSPPADGARAAAS